MKVALPGWAIDVPAGWTVIVFGDQRGLRLFLDAELVSDECSVAVQLTGAELSFERIVLPPDVTLAAHADAAMARHVRQGEPEIAAAVVGGRPVRVYGWTNGVQLLETLFVETPEAGPREILRIDVAVPAMDAELAARGHAAAARVLDTMVLG